MPRMITGRWLMTATGEASDFGTRWRITIRRPDKDGLCKFTIWFERRWAYTGNARVVEAREIAEHRLREICLSPFVEESSSDGVMEQIICQLGEPVNG